MVSKDAYKLLKWMSKQDHWMAPSEIRKTYKKFDSRSLKAAADAKYLEKQFIEDNSCWVEYRISDLGKAYLEGARYEASRSTRDWISFVFSAIALAVSIISEIN